MANETDDPIVAETRELRREMMQDAGNDLDALFDYLKADQEQYRDRLVRLVPRAAVPVATR
ncbi:MAG: hypothetical protein ACTHQM_21650 [Thermoanaerobaculia bacterium]